MDTLTRKAYAKINLGLDVLRRREDGYHEVKMIMQTVDIYDVLTFVKAPAGVFHLSVDSAQIPDDDNNLVLKAARLLFATAGIDAGVEVTLQKNIPVAAGMAGGSTDAAATLIGLNALYDLRFTTEQLQEIGVKLGADIPYCIMGGTALSQGIGEILRPLPAPPQAHLVIAKPDLMISTSSSVVSIGRSARTRSMAAAICGAYRSSPYSYRILRSSSFGQLFTISNAVRLSSRFIRISSGASVI